MPSTIINAFQTAGFSATDYGFDFYDENSFLSRHVDFLRAPATGRVAVELKVGWSSEQFPFPQILIQLGNCYLSRAGVTWLPPDYHEGNELFTFENSDEEFIRTQGLHWISSWFDLWTTPDWLLGLAQYLNGHKSTIPPEAYSYLGFAPTRTRATTHCSILATHGLETFPARCGT